MVSIFCNNSKQCSCKHSNKQLPTVAKRAGPQHIYNSQRTLSTNYNLHIANYFRHIDKSRQHTWCELPSAYCDDITYHFVNTILIMSTRFCHLKEGGLTSPGECCGDQRTVPVDSWHPRRERRNGNDARE